MSGLDFQVQIIQQKANGRKLASRWKNTDLEHKLEEYGLKVSVYISLNPERVKKYADTEPASFLQGKRDEYFLIHPDMKENQHDIALYEKLGFINNEDVFWSIHTPTAAQMGGHRTSMEIYARMNPEGKYFSKDLEPVFI